MAIQNLTAALRVGRRFADIVREESTARQLWAWGELGYIQPGHEAVDLWLFLDGGDEETERRLMAAAASLHDDFPDMHILVHLTSGDMPEDFDPMTEVYDGAEPIPLTPR